MYSKKGGGGEGVQIACKIAYVLNGMLKGGGGLGADFSHLLVATPSS